MVEKLADNEAWWTAPHFLKFFDCQWPSTDILPPNEATKAEEINDTTDVTHVYLSTEEGELRRVTLYSKLLCVTVYILKFKSLVQRVQASQKGVYHLIHKDQLTGDDIHAAKAFLLPPYHPWVKLLIQRAHNYIKHSGTAVTLSTT